MVVNVNRNTIYRYLGLFFFGLGGLGIGVPLLPTVPFWILAAVFFSKSSPELQQKIYNHPQFGKTVFQFVEQRALSPKAKVYSVAGSGGGTAFGLWITDPPGSVFWTVTIVMTLVLLWLATRPRPDENQSSLD